MNLESRVGLQWCEVFINLIFIVLLFNSCSEPNKVYEFNEEYLITTKSYLGDSLVSNKNSEYIATIKINEDNYNWTKRYFNRDLFLNELEFEEEIVIDCNINREGVITSVNNWDELYEKIESYLSYIQSEASLKNKVLDEKLLALMTDSILIQNKSTKDIQVFNYAYRLYLGDDKELVDSFSKKITDGNLIYKLTSVLDIDEVQKYVGEINEVIGEKLEFSDSNFSEFEIVIHTENYSIESIKHTSVLSNEFFENVKVVIEMSPYIQKKDIGL